VPKPRAWRASLMGSGPSYQTTGRSGEPIKLKNADTASGEARGGGGRANGSGDDHYSAAMIFYVVVALAAGLSRFREPRGV
jgi:hypothetical protein